MDKVLVANRGEIALRIMRTLREMGISSVAIYSDADRGAPHVTFADEAYYVGPSPSAQSYLQGNKVIEIALTSGAKGIHPGYGFLSENAAFAQNVEASGLTFIGPTARAIELMGNKLAAKAAAKLAGAPLLPGTDGAIDDLQTALGAAQHIGFPLLVKAAAGGGGKGMRIVREEKELEESLTRAVSEAKNAFGDGSVFLERFLDAPKHIEIQVLADKHGNMVHLGERDCSIQRRHQKVIEEAPSAVLSPETRAAMGASAVEIARSCQYVGAGTVEFLYDTDGSYYFLEMNTRLQVEHPVTELVTGLDLVREQIRVACGEELGYDQEDVKMSGHALEVRVYAEDATNNFLPDTGRLNAYRIPSGPGIRVDSGYEEGMDIPIFYDPMIAKLIVSAPTREAAIERALRAIAEYEVDGIETTLPFCAWALDQPSFRDGSMSTNFVKEHFVVEDFSSPPKSELPLLATYAVHALSTSIGGQPKYGSKKEVTSADGNPVTGFSNWRKSRSF